MERKCEDGVQWGPPLRILAPIFDFINHGSSHIKGSTGGANAFFGIDNERIFDMDDASLIVRASRDITPGEEVLINYGDATRPAWRCLTSYGFVPEYDSFEVESLGDGGESAENVAELWMHGRRYEVEPHSVPMELVEMTTMNAMLDSEGDDDREDNIRGKNDGNSGAVLTPFVARTISKRATEAAMNLITEPEVTRSKEEWDNPEYVRSAFLANKLCWSQHRVLLAFAENLKLFSASLASETTE